VEALQSIQIFGKYPLESNGKDNDSSIDSGISSSFEYKSL
jgi:hypothetical protein